MILLLNPTGEIYEPNCTTNGMTYLKSRYFTLSDATHKPGPRLANKAKIMKIGNKVLPARHKLIINHYSNQYDKTYKSSINAVTRVAMGMIILGK